MNAPVVRCAALVKTYGATVAVDGLDLEIPAGQCLGLLGPNGAGKTTTVEMLEGLHEPDSGTLELFGHAWRTGHDQELRERIGVLLQETQLADKLSTLEVLQLFRSFYSRGPSVASLVRELDLGAFEHQRYHTLSGGQKQRVAMACALAGEPDILFLDEPTTGLDPRAKKSLWEVVERFRDSGGTVLLTTHYMEEAAALCDRVAIMDQGKIIADGTPRTLVEGLGMVQFVEFETADPVDEAALAALPAVHDVRRRAARWRLQIGRELAAIRHVLAELERQHVTPIGLATHQATLEDVFLKLTGRGLEREAMREADSSGEAGAA